MNPLKLLRQRLPLPLVVLVGVLAGLVAAVIVVRAVDGELMRRAWDEAIAHPGEVVIASAAFGFAFVLRAIAWQRVLPGLSFGQSLAGIHLTLGANHVLPFRLGEPVRVLSVVKRAETSVDAATASTVMLRSADIIAIFLLGLAVAPGAYMDLVGWFGWLVVAGVIVAAMASWGWLLRMAGRDDIKLPGPFALALTGSAWLLEAILVWQTARWAGLEISATDAALVTTVAVAAQIAAIAPGGFGTYEAAAVAAYVSLGYDAEPALVAALSAHALKTAYSIIVGVIAMAFPSPSFIGRLRLRSETGEREIAPIPGPPAPIVLFMPAYNEEEAVGDCIARAPQEIDGHPVEVLVIDDGSADNTIAVAEAAGATVIALPQNRGLGAAVREGLAAGVERGAAAVVFCDADGEYPPEELANLVRPILADEADYVCGSRFAGEIEHMRPHRRFGNQVLTKTLSVIARRKITDGQTGYRAFSPAAAARAEVIHDFNYAQVITLDLLAKGYRYLEVPISYRFRTTGESFIKLGPYLRKVVPAVYREVNAA
ncbi:MAG: lysylphosphatidylglycerol synthase domain-containing protein [Actinomycetota bacterium]